MTVNKPFQLSPQALHRLSRARASAVSFADDVAEGFFEITHNSFALIGLVVAFACVALVAKPDLRQTGETYLMTWLQERQPQDLSVELEEPEFVELTAVERATAANPKELPTQQAALAFWPISKACDTSTLSGSGATPYLRLSQNASAAC